MKVSLWTWLMFLSAFVYNGNAGECQKPVLDNPLVLTNSALLKNQFLDASNVTVKCAIGYEVDQGSDIITCTDGEWNKPELTCKKKDCGLPESSPNMRYLIPSGTLFGTYITPVCDRGYYLQGSSHRRCFSSGWSGRSECLLVTCGKCPEIPHSVIVIQPAKEILEFEDVIEYSCEDKYTLVGNSSVVCQGNGKYSSLPQCKGECQKPVLDNPLVLTNSALLKNQFLDASNVTVKCAIGYEVDQGSDIITCTDGEWNKPELTCKKKDCGLPESSPNMRYLIPSGTLFGTYITPVCDSGYYLQGSSHRQCFSSGWSGRSECLLVTCGKCPEIPHSVIVIHPAKEILEFEDVIEYSCEDKYTLVGNSSVVCQGNGKYSSLPQCKEREGDERVVSLYWILKAIGITVIIFICFTIIYILVRCCKKQKGIHNRTAPVS